MFPIRHILTRFHGVFPDIDRDRVTLTENELNLNFIKIQHLCHSKANANTTDASTSKREAIQLTEEERSKIQKSMNEAQKALDDGLILDQEARSTLYRMILYYQEQLTVNN